MPRNNLTWAWSHAEGERAWEILQHTSIHSGGPELKHVSQADGNLAVGQNQWYYFGIGAPPILVYFSGDWDVHWGYNLAFDPWPFDCTLVEEAFLETYLRPFHCVSTGARQAAAHTGPWVQVREETHTALSMPFDCDAGPCPTLLFGRPLRQMQ